MPKLKTFRHQLLLNEAIRRAYESTEQFPEWRPHLTLGYPDAPAREDDSDYPGLHSVRFDRLAVWFGDYEGPEVRLKYDDHTMEVAMSGMTTAFGGEMAAEEIFHYGVKGMKWGVRTNPDGTTSVDQTRVRKSLRSTDKAVTVTQRKAGTYVKTSGGKRQTASVDAVRTQAARQKAKKSTTDSLSTKELKAAIERMRLEQEFAKLDKKVSRKGESFLKRLLNNPEIRDAAARLARLAAS